ncbi:hypothetical protein JQ597_29480 [Bradyrhizobium sp. AUGA SZCCT0177]|uniref:hypothetical protein n=1 Tax=Bradyrhizobium sp. AUGA SZCCT0177 TaxID=2807665 RepID=UPI001BA77DC1|nr:hypothetical protein [Bradyrhizobium sp. AUGA SZCCT0177]MBR1286192.1 hypothetical protein [Bradyrhizobium sp. AUGA SZCCT0177]
MQSLSNLSYKFQASAVDGKSLLDTMRYQREHSYDGIARMRLEGVDADGIEWTCGYTIPHTWNPSEGRFEGELQSLIRDDASESITRSSCTELIYSVDRHHPLALAMIGHKEKKIEMLGSTISFSYDTKAGCVMITASHSEQLPPTFTEAWLVEPLRILFGQPAMPRLHARNLGDRSIVFVSTVPQVKNAVWSAFWHWGDDAKWGDFFEWYSRFLNLIALARDDRGHPNFEPHPITRFYDELGQVALASRWVMALTLASASEGLTKLLRPVKPMTMRDKNAEKVEKAALVKVIENSTAPVRLKGTAVTAVHNFNFEKETTKNNLRSLKAKAIITPAQFSAWNEIRNSVMHGILISPFSHEEEDKKLSDLVELVHTLTRELLRTSDANYQANVSCKTSIDVHDFKSGGT